MTLCIIGPQPNGPSVLQPRWKLGTLPHVEIAGNKPGARVQLVFVQHRQGFGCHIGPRARSPLLISLAFASSP